MVGFTLNLIFDFLPDEAEPVVCMYHEGQCSVRDLLQGRIVAAGQAHAVTQEEALCLISRR